MKRTGPGAGDTGGILKSGMRFKAGLGTRGCMSRTGSTSGSIPVISGREHDVVKDRPLVRYNLIKRIGEYKMAVIGSKRWQSNNCRRRTPEIQKAVGDRRKELSRRGALPPSPAGRIFPAGRTMRRSSWCCPRCPTITAPRKNGWDWGCCGRRCCARLPHRYRCAVYVVGMIR